MHRYSVSDTPRERQIYEQAARDEEALLVDHVKGLLKDMEPPPGWRRKYDKPGRPAKTTRRGRKQAYGWKPMAIVLCLLALWECTRREARSRLRRGRDRIERIGLASAPTLARSGALDRFNESWLKELNRRLVESAKRGSAGVRQTRIAGWTVLVSDSRVPTPG